MSDIRGFIVALYDDHVRSIGGEVKSSEAMEAIRPQVIDMLQQQERDLDGEATRLIRDEVSATRSSRRTSLKRDLEYLLDGAFNEDGAYVDPILDRAYGMGRVDGADKTLRHWTEDDFQQLVLTSYRVAGEATAAATELDEITSHVLSRMTSEGAGTLGDLEW